ncbi:discoidin domain-containing protein [Kribbella sp. NPDC056861]|uniref:discoidin domain-containing protein n=1 Tax=Kribbella sp. NPDC056861 TaxID=3154857 RepID=UPI003442AF7F
MRGFEMLVLVAALVVAAALPLAGSSDAEADAAQERAATPVNLAIGKAITATDSLKNFEARKAIDGNSSTYWAAADGRKPKTLEVDLGSAYAVTGVEQNFKDVDTHSFLIEASTNRTSWTRLLDKTTGARGQTFSQGVSGNYRYVRLTVTGSASNFWAGSTEFAIYGIDPQPRNLARGVSATSSSHGPGYEPFKAVDGDGTSYWGAEVSGMPQWLMLDLGSSIAVDRIEQSFVDNDTWTFKIEGSQDKTNWQLLLDETDGVVGRVFSKVLSGNYRYLKLTVLGSAAGHWACSQELKVFGTGEPVTTKWWESRSGVMRFYPVWQQLRLDAITAQLDTLKSQGFRAIELSPVSDGNKDLWAGLPVMNLYQVDPDIGTMQDFEELLQAAHARGMKVIIFTNPGYASIDSPYFQKAQDDFRANVQSVERSWFDLRKQPGAYPELWHYSARAQGYYWGTWDAKAPSFNYSSQAWLDEARKYLRFWMDKGVDGIALDAPNVYHTTTVAKNNYAITDVLRNYDTFMNGEGVREPQYIYDWHYNSLQDYTITQWAEPPNPGSSAILSAIDSGNPSGLENTLKNYRDLMVNAGGVTQTAPNWGRTNYPVDRRLLEIATMTSMGTFFYLHNDYYTILPHEQQIPNWPADQRETLYKLIRAQNSSPALAPLGLRVKLPTSNDQKYYAYKRTSKDGTAKALVLLNFQSTPQTVSVDLTGTGIALGQTPTDLVEGTAGPAITGATYQVQLPAFGFKLLSVQ